MPTTRRQLLGGASLLALAAGKALAQPVPIGGPAGGYQTLLPGPQPLAPGGPPSLDLNFLSTTFPPGITWTRNSIATDGLYTDAPGSTYNTFGVNVPRISATRGLLIEDGRTNSLLNSDAPVTQTTASLGNNTYCLWVVGTGSATSSAGTAVGTGFGVATAGVPNVFTVTTPGTVVVTVAGSLTRFQLEAQGAGSVGAVPTSYIPTAGATVTRQVELGTMPVGGWFNAAEGTQVVDFLKIVAPGGVFNDIPCLYLSNVDMIGARLTGGQNIASVIWNANTLFPTQQVPWTLGAVNKNGATYKTSPLGMSSSANGSAVSFATPGGIPAVNQIKFGITRSATLDGWCQRFRYWPRAMGAAELQTVTT